MAPHAVDTNLIIRVITFDVPALAEQAMATLRPLSDNSVELPLYVIAEVTCVLAGNPAYLYSRERISAKLLTVAELPQLSLNRDLLYQVMDHFTATKLDFVDCLLLAQNRLFGQTILTFDRPLQKQLAKS